MKERIRTLIVGIMIGALLVPTAFATVSTVTKELFYNNIKITLDGNEITPTDANGNYVEPFIIEGTTYLPVRGIANALDLGVEWDGDANTVKLSSDKKDEPSADGITKVGDVVYDVDGVKLIFFELQSHLPNGYEYKFIIDNTTDKDIRFNCFNVSVNSSGHRFGLSDTPVIPAGKKAETSLMVATGPNSSPKIDKVEVIEMKVSQTYIVDNTYEETERKPVILNFE